MRELTDVRGRLTNRNHALSVVIQILPHYLQQPFHAPPTLRLRNNPAGLALHLLPAQVAILHLHLGKRHGQPPHDPLVGHAVDVCFQHDTKVEDELVPDILVVGDEYGVAQDDVLAVGVGGGHEPVDKGLARDDVRLQDVEVEDRRLWVPDEAGGRLGDYLRAW